MRTVLLPAGVVFSLALLLLVQGVTPREGEAIHLMPTVGIDAVTGGNTATSLGNIDTCVSVAQSSTVQVDVYIQNVHDLKTWGAVLLFDPTKVDVTAAQIDGMIMGSGGLSITTDDLTPGQFTMLVTPLFITTFIGKDGSGVLARLTLEGVSAGTSALTLSTEGGDLAFLGGDFGAVSMTLSAESPTAAEVRVGDVCPGGAPDFDGDGEPDSTDNCPAWPNSDQSLPPWPVDVEAANDPDCDGFTTADENAIGTDPNLACGTNAWPPDITDDHVVDFPDLNAIVPALFQSLTGNERFNLAVDGAIDFQDLNAALPFLFASCT